MNDHKLEYKLFQNIDNPLYSESIIKDLASEMPNHGIEHYFQTKGSMLSQSDMVVVAVSGSNHVGIMVLSKLNATQNRSGIYIRTLLVSEKYHGKNLAYEIISHGFKAFYEMYNYFPDFIMMTTYNPITYRMMKGFSKGSSSSVYVYPSTTYKNSSHQKTIAEQYAQQICPDCEFDSHTGVIIGGGGGIPATFWKNYPATRDKEILEYFKTHLGERDRLLCIIFCEEELDKKIVMTNLNIKEFNNAKRHIAAVI